ncbi:MAG: hypothetical protein ACXVCO_01230 [Ktedonobacterales bacterium]
MTPSERTEQEKAAGRRQLAIRHAAEQIDIIREMFQGKNWRSKPPTWRGKFTLSSVMSQNDVVTLKVSYKDDDGETQVIVLEDPLDGFPSERLITQLALIAPQEVTS